MLAALMALATLFRGQVRVKTRTTKTWMMLEVLLQLLYFLLQYSKYTALGVLTRIQTKYLRPLETPYKILFLCNIYIRFWRIPGTLRAHFPS